MKIISHSWIDGKDVHYPTDEPDPALGTSSDREKPCLDISQANSKIWRPNICCLEHHIE